jgi:hypothetical protein
MARGGPAVYGVDPGPTDSISPNSCEGSGHGALREGLTPISIYVAEGWPKCSPYVEVPLEDGL